MKLQENRVHVVYGLVQQNQNDVRIYTCKLTQSGNDKIQPDCFG